MKVTLGEFMKWQNALREEWYFDETCDWYEEFINVEGDPNPGTIVDFKRGDLCVRWQGTQDNYGKAMSLYSEGSTKKVKLERFADMFDGFSWFAAWKKEQSTTTLAFDVPNEKLDEVIEAVKKLGGKQVK